MYTQLCILKLVTRVQTYKQDLESVISRCVLLYTHSSTLKILNFCNFSARDGQENTEAARKTLTEEVNRTKVH
jgi:hypothetical protein